MYFFIRSVKGLGEGDSCDESALSWVKKSRKLNNEKEIADKRVCLYICGFIIYLISALIFVCSMFIVVCVYCYCV